MGGDDLGNTSVGEKLQVVCHTDTHYAVIVEKPTGDPKHWTNQGDHAVGYIQQSSVDLAGAKSNLCRLEPDGQLHGRRDHAKHTGK